MQDGLECNSHYLLFRGWKGLWIEGSLSEYQGILSKFGPVVSAGILSVENSFITKENINQLLSKRGFSEDIDLLSIDIDGNDYHVWKEISVVFPRVVCIEYNAKFPPDCEWIMPYFSAHIWQGNDRHGASLKALELLGREKGYQLVGTNVTGVNAFFVRQDLAADLFPMPATAENLYNAPNYQLKHLSGHPSEACLLDCGVEMREEPDCVTVNAPQIYLEQGADALYEALETASRQSTSLLVEGCFHNSIIQQVVQRFLERNKNLLERTATEMAGDAGNLLITLRCCGFSPTQTGYAALEDAYSRAYYLHDCGGYDVFRESQGKRVDQRLTDLCQLVHPQAGEQILDIGCGRGELSYALAKSGAEVTGVDYSGDAIALALETYTDRPVNLRYLRADIFQMPDLETYDKLVMADVVEHIEQPVLEQIFEKLRNSLSPKGLLVIHTAPNLDYYRIAYPRKRKSAAACGCYLPAEPRSYYEKKMHINEQTPASLEAALKKHFPFVRVWTGQVYELAEEKSPEQASEEIDIFAVACQDDEPLRRCEDLFTKPPVFEQCHVTFAAKDVRLPAGQTKTVADVSIVNHGEQVLTSRRKYPICLAYRICDLSGDVVFDLGKWTTLEEPILAGEEGTVAMPLFAPSSLERGRDYLVQVTLVADQCFWFDQTGENLGRFLLHLE